jgi:hypothetical protein
MVFKYHLSKIAKIADEDVSVNTLRDVTEPLHVTDGGFSIPQLIDGDG